MKITAHVFVSQESFQSQPSFHVNSNDMVSFGYQLVSSHEIEFDPDPSFSLQSFQLQKLAKEKEAVIQKFQQTIARIDDEVKKYQCLEMSQSDQYNTFKK